MKKPEKLCMIAIVSVSTRTKFKFQEELRCYYHQQQVPAEPVYSADYIFSFDVFHDHETSEERTAEGKKHACRYGSG